MIPLIGFAGRAGCGKSYAAKHLVAKYGFERTRFADPLKDMLRVLGLGDDEIEGVLKEDPCDLLCGKTPRFAMQRLGTEWGRNLIGADLWIDAWGRRADALLAAGRSIVVDDVRFENEVAMIRQRGGEVIWIERPMAGASMMTHPSESLRAEACDAHIFNLGDERFGRTVAQFAVEETYI